MSEPKRLVDECHGALEQSLLQAGRRLQHTERRRLKVMGALGVGSAALLGSKTSLAMLSGWKKTIAGAMITCGGVGSVVAYQQLSQPEPQRTEAAALAPGFVVGSASGRVLEAPKSTAPTPPEPLPIEQPRPEPAPEVPPAAQPVEPERKATPVSPGRTERTKPPRPSLPPAAEVRTTVPNSIQSAQREEPQEAPADPLSEELALLDQARAALRGSGPAPALRHLRHYEQRFPKGSLAFEAEVLKVQALAASGKRKAASERAKRLLRRNPNNVAASRLKRYVID